MSTYYSKLALINKEVNFTYRPAKVKRLPTFYNTVVFEENHLKERHSEAMKLFTWYAYLTERKITSFLCLMY